MDALLQRFLNPAYAVPLALLIIYTIYVRLTAGEATPVGVPWIGRDTSKYLSKLRATFASFKGFRPWLAEGYEKYGKQHKSYIIADYSTTPGIIVPRSQTRWLIDQPDHVLSAHQYHYDTLEGEYAFTSPRVVSDPYHEGVIHKYLPRRLGAQVPEMWEEISSALDDVWGVDTTQWKEIGVLDSLMQIIPRGVNRMLVGLPLCRNEEYISNMTKFAQACIMTSQVYLRYIPQWLKPVLGPLVTIPNNRYWRNTTKYTIPLIKGRLVNFKRKSEDAGFEWEEPNDYISWHIEHATSENRQDELTPDIMSRRLMAVNFAGIHTTSLSTTNCLFDLISSDPSKGYLEGIREEVTRVFAEEGGQWTKAGLAKLHRTDSAIRESLRISSFVILGAMRKVLPAEGIENKAEGWRAPQGTYIGLDSYSVQHDAEIYPDPNTYDAFRFSRAREEMEDTEKSKDSAEILKQKSVGLVTTSETFLSFSHGRHACPGRFFVALELKLLLAKMFMDYEVAPLQTRPPSPWIGSTVLPPMKATMKIRRREGSVNEST